MSAYLEELGISPIKASVEAVRILNKNIGNGGNQFEKWETKLLGEVVLRLENKIEVDLASEKFWTRNPLIKVPMSIKTWMNFEDLCQEDLSVLPVASGLDKPGIMKPGTIYYLESARDIKGKAVNELGTSNGLYYVAAVVRGAVSVAMWKTLGLVLTQKHREVDNRFWHNEDEQHQFPTCEVCINRTYMQPDDKAVSDSSQEPNYYCAMTGEPIDTVSSRTVNYLNVHDHGLLHGMKGHWFLYGDKYVTGASATDDRKPATVRTGRSSARMSGLREQDYEYNADSCPFYAPRRVLPERGVWRKDLSRVYLPNIILDF